MSHRKLLAALLLIGTLLAAFLTPKAQAANFLWQVRSPKGAEAYILGSIHLAHNGLYPLRDPIMKAFERSNALVVEISTDDLPPGEMVKFIFQKGLASDQRPLLERLSPETKELFLKSGLHNPILDPFAPWLAALTLQVEVMTRYGFTDEYGIDKHFIALAKERKMKIIALETLEEQMGMLADMSPVESDLFLRSTLLELEDLPQTMGAMLEAWVNGDRAEFNRVFFQEYDRYPELVPLMDRIIFRRNEIMAERIAKLIRGPKVHFIVVGAGHLVGEPSILSLLEARGFEITQL